MSDVAHPKPEVDFVPRRLADVDTTLTQLSLLNDEMTAVAVVKAIARSIARSETIPNVGYRTECHLSFLSIVPKPLAQMSDQVVAQMRGFQKRFPDGGDPADEQAWGVVSLDHQSLRSLVDWLIALRRDDTRAYAKVPRMAFSEMWQAQRRWHDALAKRKVVVAAGDLASCPVLHRYDDGWAWVWVRTDAERDAEGDAMGHCVGQGAYDKLGRGGAIVSLRDPAGRPHVTVEIAGVKRMQAQGRGNTPPSAEKYGARIAEATVRIGAAVTKHGEPRWLDDAEAMAIVAEHVARNVRKTGHHPTMRIEIPQGVPAYIARAVAGR